LAEVVFELSPILIPNTSPRRSISGLPGEVFDIGIEVDICAVRGDDVALIDSTIP
jgi:hypothetical protein